VYPARSSCAAGHVACRAALCTTEIEMPKMKTKSAAKKRFSFTATGRVKAGPAGKRHGMIKRSAKFVRNTTGTMILSDSDAKIVKKYMPYDR
jgi:large subunit ribosomal protein L35